jgi:hypothetical protein
VPLKPGRQLHVKLVLLVLVHVPPCRQGVLSHGSVAAPFAAPAAAKASDTTSKRPTTPHANVIAA